MSLTSSSLREPTDRLRDQLNEVMWIFHRVGCHFSLLVNQWPCNPALHSSVMFSRIAIFSKRKYAVGSQVILISSFNLDAGLRPHWDDGYETFNSLVKLDWELYKLGAGAEKRLIQYIRRQVCIHYYQGKYLAWLIRFLCLFLPETLLAF